MRYTLSGIEQPIEDGDTYHYFMAKISQLDPFIFLKNAYFNHEPIAWEGASHFVRHEHISVMLIIPAEHPELTELNAAERKMAVRNFDLLTRLGVLRLRMTSVEVPYVD